MHRAHLIDSWDAALTIIARRRRAITLLAAVATGAMSGGTVGVDWHYVVTGGNALFAAGPAGNVHLYAAFPDIQMGPLTLALGRAASVLGDRGAWLAAVIGQMVLALIALEIIERTVSAVRMRPPSPRRAAAQLVGGVGLIVGWGDTALRWGHLDDILVVFCALAAGYAVAVRRPALAALALGLAIAAKPTALVLLPVLLALPRPMWMRAATTSGAVIGAAYLPFVLGDTRTLAAGSPRITVLTGSVPDLFHMGAGYLQVVRPLQLLLGLMLVAAVARRGRWHAALGVGVAVRLLLDPGAFSYYTVSLIAGLLLVELIDWPNRLPLGSLCAWPVLGVIGQGTLSATTRLAVCLVTLALALLGPRGWGRRRRSWTRHRTQAVIPHPRPELPQLDRVMPRERAKVVR